jgi:1-acyl-sn-glycerol-3-phosphate acyltransferase
LPRRPFFRPLLVWILGTPALVLSVSLCFLLAPFLGGHRAFWLVGPRYISLMARAFGIRRKLEGWEALPAEIRSGVRPAVFVGNHSSLFDPPLMISTLPSHPAFVAKRELASVPFLGWVIWLAGFIFIDRDRRGSARRSLEQAAARIHGGQGIVAFPSGTRSPDGSLLPVKKGAFHLAWKADVPVVPFAIQGGQGILPKGTWRVGGGLYAIRVGTPLEPGECPDSEALRRAAALAVQALMGSPVR